MNKDFLTIAVVTVITVFAWIIFDIYHASTTSNITEVQTQLAQPLNPNFDPNTLNILKSRAVNTP